MRDERIEEAMGSVSSGVNMYTVAVGVVVNVDVYLDVDIDRSRGEDQSSSKGGLGYEMASGRGRRSGKRQVKGVRHERKGVSVGIGGSKDVVDGGLVMERGIDKVLGNLIRWSADSRPVWRTHKRNIVQLRWVLSINLNFSKSFWSPVWPSKSDALRSGNIQILWAL